MRVICAPDKFKDSLTAVQAAEAMGRGVKRASPEAEVDLCPVADGGEGTVDALLAATGGTARVTRVPSPRVSPADAGVADALTVRARWGLLGRTADEPTAVVEMSAASGLKLLPLRLRDPLHTSTHGTGIVLHEALDQNVARIILGIGGSATNDGGCGAAQRLGVRFYNAAGKLIDRPITGETLHEIARIDLHECDARLPRTDLVVACDVSNPLTGQRGAAHVYGPQKGAPPDACEHLDAGLVHLARIVREQLGVDYEHTPGAGAAGGMGFGLMAFFGARLRPGIALVLDAVGFERRVENTDLCLTGEGRLDDQSFDGKVVFGVAHEAHRHRVLTYALAGQVATDDAKLRAHGLAGYMEIAPNAPVEDSLRNAADYLERATAALVSGLV